MKERKVKKIEKQKKKLDLKIKFLGSKRSFVICKFKKSNQLILKMNSDSQVLTKNNQSNFQVEAQEWKKINNLLVT